MSVRPAPSGLRNHGVPPGSPAGLPVVVDEAGSRGFAPPASTGLALIKSTTRSLIDQHHVILMVPQVRRLSDPDSFSLLSQLRSSSLPVVSADVTGARQLPRP